MSGWPFGKLVGKAALFGLIYATLGMALFGWPVKGALMTAAIAGLLFVVLMHVLERKRWGASRHDP